MLTFASSVWSLLIGSWLSLVIIRIVFANVLVPIIVKVKIKDQPLDIIRTFIARQFAWCFLFTLVAFLIWPDWRGLLNPWLLLVVVLGLLNSYAVQNQWMAYGVNLSKSSLFMFLDDIIALNIGFYILHETDYMMNSELAIGLLLCLGTILIFYFVCKPGDKPTEIFLGYILKYTILWGIVAALYRHFNMVDISPPNFMLVWYASAYIGIKFLQFFYGDKNVNLNAIPGYNAFRLLQLSFYVWFSMVLYYSVAKLAPVTVYKPIFLICQSYIQALVGFYYFKEGENLSFGEKFAYAIGLVGVAFIALSF